MSDQLSLTQKWLRQNIHPYTRKDLVYSHVDAVLAAFPTLRPKTDVYTFDDGRSQLLLCIHGLLPISYRRASYNIPIAVWLTIEYPTQPPLVYVVPTSDMLVKAGKFVDVSGRCEPEYVQAWQRKSEGCNLRALMEALTDQFSQQPPVYAKPQATSPPPRPREATPPASGTPDYSNRPPPAAPGSPQRNGYGASPSSSVQPTQTPPRPPFHSDPPSRPPTRSPPPPVPRYSHAPSQNMYHPPRSATASTFALDPPIYTTPPTHNHAQSPSHSHLRSSSASHFSSPPPQAAPAQTYLHTEPTSPLGQRWSMHPNSTIQSSGPSPPPPPPPPPQALHPPFPIQAPSHTPPALPLQAPLQPQPITPHVAPTPPRNFLEEDDAPLAPPPPTNAPPRPPNPEILHLHAQVHAKLTSEFATFDQALAADTQRLRAAQSDLLAGEPAIRDEMARLEAVRDVCSVVSSRLRSTVESAEANVNELRRKGDPEVDELICSTTIVYNQLVNLVAEDNAIEDTIYHLHRALNAGRIDLDKFLRTTRALAEEQFMKRALAEKIVASIPLGAWR